VKLAIITSAFPFGDGESFLFSEISQLANHFDVLVLPTLPRTPDNRYPLNNVRTRRLSTFSLAVLPLAVAAMFRAPARSAKALACLLSNATSLRVLLKNLAVFPKALAVAEILFREGTQHIHAHWLSTPSTVAFLSAGINSISWSATGHRWDIEENNILAAKLKTAAFFRLISIKTADTLTKVLRCKSPKVKIIHIGVDCSPDPPQAPANGHQLNILYPARLDPMKGHKLFLLALRRFLNQGAAAHCFFAGDGPFRKHLQKMILELRLAENVTMAPVPHFTLLQWLASGKFDIVALTSGDRTGAYEGIPVSLMEGMAAGLPCIATRTGGTPELVNSSNGFLVTPENVEEICIALNSLMDNGVRKDLGRNAHHTVFMSFNAERTSKQLADLIFAALTQ
jgi:colanic acid/amylovoran biosynthesis glycosyltransferase